MRLRFQQREPSKNYTLRTRVRDRETWEMAAARAGVTLAEFLRVAANAAAQQVLQDPKTSVEK